jgi:hypothetical protein
MENQEKPKKRKSLIQQAIRPDPKAYESTKEIFNLTNKEPKPTTEKVNAVEAWGRNKK